MAMSERPLWEHVATLTLYTAAFRFLLPEGIWHWARWPMYVLWAMCGVLAAVRFVVWWMGEEGGGGE